MGLVGFTGSFGSKWFGGFARRYNPDGSLYDVPAQAIRSIKRQAKNPLFQNIKFICSDYKSLEIKDSLIYCDPPYQNTTQYKHNQFNHTEFYEWCVNMAKNNIVLVSEYNINHPNFQEIWNKEVGVMLGSGVNKGGNQTRIEIYKNNRVGTIQIKTPMELVGYEDYEVGK